MDTIEHFWGDSTDLAMPGYFRDVQEWMRKAAIDDRCIGTQRNRRVIFRNCDCTIGRCVEPAEISSSAYRA